MFRSESVWKSHEHHLFPPWLLCSTTAQHPGTDPRERAQGGLSTVRPEPPERERNGNAPGCAWTERRNDEVVFWGVDPQIPQPFCGFNWFHLVAVWGIGLFHCQIFFLQKVAMWLRPAIDLEDGKYNLLKPPYKYIYIYNYIYIINTPYHPVMETCPCQTGTGTQFMTL